MRILIVIALPILLGACAVTSEAPLFAVRDAAPHPLAQGLWALSGPGCEVGPLPAGQKLPACALGVYFGRDSVVADLDSVPPMLKSGPGGAGAAPGALDFAGASSVSSTPNAFLLADGKPLIFQTQEKPRSDASASGKLGYYAIQPLQTNGAGEIVKAVFWPIMCPAKGEDASGFTINGPECVAQNPAAVRRQAPHIPPVFSFYLTWVRPGSPPSGNAPR
jgi:hypothetical protein